MQLKGQFEKVASRPNTISFAASTRHGGLADIDQGLNICTATLALLRQRLQKIREQRASHLARKQSLFRAWTGETPVEGLPTTALLEHCELVVEYLEALNGRITEKLELHRQKQKKRAALLASTPIASTYQQRPSLPPPPPSSPHEGQQLLQLENSRMVEEAANELLGTLANTEAQVLELARLQATLQAHLHAQFLTAARIFDDSEQSVLDTQKGNTYLRKAAKDSSFGTRIFVFVVVMLAVALALMHHLRS